jgi:hypothetical protein
MDADTPTPFDVEHWIATLAEGLWADMEAEPPLCSLCDGLGFRPGPPGGGTRCCPECGGDGYGR